MKTDQVLVEAIGIVRKAQGAMHLTKFLAYIVILCFERRYPKQNSVIRLKSNILAQKKFWARYATGWALLRRGNQNQIVRKKQTADPAVAVYNGNTLVDLAVTVYPVSMQ